MQNRKSNTCAGHKVIPAVINIPAIPKSDLMSKKDEAQTINHDQWMNIVRYELDLLYSRFLTQAKVCASISKLLDETETSNNKSNLTELNRLICSECARLEWDDEEIAADTYENEIRWLKQRLATIMRHRAGASKEN